MQTARADPEPLWVQLMPCTEDALDLTAMLEIARAEIAPRAVLTDARASAAGGLIIDACQPTHVLLRIVGEDTPTHTVELQDVPRSLRPRIAALALAELVATSTETGPAVSPKSSPVNTPATPRFVFDPELEAQPAPPATRSALALTLGPEVRVFFRSPRPSAGAHLTFRFRRLEAGLLGLFGGHTVFLGQLRTGIVAMSLRAPLWRPLSSDYLELGLGAEGGVTWASSQPSDARETDQAPTGVAPFLAGIGQVSTGTRMSEDVQVRATLAAGYSQGLDAQAGSRTMLSTHGPFLTFVACLHWSP